MNTPDTEWRERLWEWVEVAPSGAEVLNCYPESVVAIIEEAISSRDTYWKERVKMSIGGINFRRQIKGAFEDYAHAHPEVPQFNSDVRRGIEKRLHTNVRTLVLSKLINKDYLK